MSLYEKFMELHIDRSLIGLEKGDEEGGYFCTPVGSKVIGWESGGIHYCFIEGFGEKVFAVNPETAEEHFVRPLAENFGDFIRLVLACGGTTAAEQISGWNKEQFCEFLENDDPDFAARRRPVLDKIQNELSLEPMENPFEYVKKLQADFDYGKIKFTGEYYDVLGLEPPEGTEISGHEPFEFRPVVFTFVKNEE
ncbi:MAG: hypothetical protein IJ306_08850 [Oscillospiraceae bacterium]|nr:hypothetical protein [Oscillospiraceae bacterium]